MTPVIVPGLAANKINGVSDRFWSPATLETGAELPRNMVNPIQASTPPPATEKASRETPKTWSTFAPTSAAMTRMISTANAALVASASRVALTGFDLRKDGSADQGIHQRKNRHNRL